MVIDPEPDVVGGEQAADQVELGDRERDGRPDRFVGRNADRLLGRGGGHRPPYFTRGLTTSIVPDHRDRAWTRPAGLPLVSRPISNRLEIQKFCHFKLWRGAS